MNPEGVGLGLLISNMLANNLAFDYIHPGLQVTSKYEEGTTFYFVIHNYSYDELEGNSK